MQIREFIKMKGPVVTCRAEDSIGDAADVLAEHRIGVMAVLDSHFKLVGMLSERDVVRGLSQHKANLLNLTVGEVMSKSVVSCAPGNSFADAANLMRRNRIRHLPVLEDEMLVGLISVRDMLEIFGPTEKNGLYVVPGNATHG